MSREGENWLGEMGLLGNGLHGDKEIKIRIPVRHHLRLHSLKVLKGQPIHETVKEAVGMYLDRYFQEQQGTAPEAGAKEARSGPEQSPAQERV